MTPTRCRSLSGETFSMLSSAIKVNFLIVLLLLVCGGGGVIVMLKDILF
jgi:hypothetical protein